jgi:hypothetical protein
LVFHRSRGPQIAFPDYLNTYFKVETVKGLPDSISIMESAYSFPTNVIRQAAARILSEEATLTFRNTRCTAATLEYLSIQHQHIQSSVVRGLPK